MEDMGDSAWLVRKELKDAKRAQNHAEHVEKLRAKTAGRRAMRSLGRMADKEMEGRPTVEFQDPRLLPDQELVDTLSALMKAEQYDWLAIARPEQIFNKEDAITLCLAARGWGKTRACVEAVREACKTPGTRVAVIAADHVALRDVLFEGVSGFIACIPPEEIEHYKKGLGDIALKLKNGSIIVGFTAGNPDSVRGSSFSLLLCDEYAAWPRHKAQDMFDQARMTLRESENPRVIVATTPKRVPHILKLVEMAKDPELRIRVITGRSRDNTALTEDWFRQMEATYGNSRIGRQELEGELVMDAENALWTWDMIENARRPSDMEVPRIIRAVIGIDPSGSKDGDATGLVVMGVDTNKTLWVLENATTQGTPAVRYGAACRAAYRWGCREAVFETSYGGDNAAYGFQETWKNLQASGEISAESSCPRMIPSRIKGDKAGRAMPVVNLYEAQLDNPERRRIWHDLPTESNGLVTLEDEQLSWSTESTKSPNCLDALVHVARYLARELGWEINISAPGQNGPISPFSTRRRTGGGYNPYGK